MSFSPEGCVVEAKGLSSWDMRIEWSHVRGITIVGSDEVHPALFSSQVLARFVRMIWPSQRVEEMAVYLNLVPLPIRWRVRFLEPIMPSHAGTDPDPLEMLEKSELIRNRIQHNLDAMLVERGSAI